MTVSTENWGFSAIQITVFVSKAKRFVPVEILDVAGLVPGASEGKGLGNQFLDDLRQADAFIHVVDFSGTTDIGGKRQKITIPRKILNFRRRT